MARLVASFTWYNHTTSNQLIFFFINKITLMEVQGILQTYYNTSQECLPF